ncbi:tat (twin-arginine translocation) pathway signal sequence [Cryptosporangium arvum]|uniref:tat (twin-arginine translocation) pathway signal sequence n=1 Tax=Cryptosporangium arvum TaxID=80871 RepID=UPI0012ED8720|nr:tat (twin-arginine translocation) pathway signal sequence [Cryptosporangium arvum]
MRKVLIFLSATLVVAFVVVPGWVAGSGADDSFRPAFVAWWRSGSGDLSPELARIVDHWFRYHVVKGLLAALLLAVLIALGRRVTRWALVPVVALGAVALAAVMANVQGAVAPFASLFPLLSADDRRAPAAALRAGIRSPALERMIDGYTAYHAAMVGAAGTVAAVFLVATVVLVRRRVGRLPVTVAALFAVGALVVTVANVTTTLDPEPGLLGLLDGGW